MLTVKQITNNKFLYFVIKASVLYSLCFGIYEFFIKRYTQIDQLFIRKIIDLCTFLLQTIGYNTFTSKETNDIQVFGVDGSNGVWIGGPCNGITLLFLFAIFIIAYPSKQIKHKYWYVPIGCLIVFSSNIIRIISLALIALYKPECLDFNHTYTFTFLIYSLVFGLWMLWVNKYADA